MRLRGRQACFRTPTLCPAIACVLRDGARVRKSEKWLQKRRSRVGDFQKTTTNEAFMRRHRPPSGRRDDLESLGVGQRGVLKPAEGRIPLVEGWQPWAFLAHGVPDAGLKSPVARDTPTEIRTMPFRVG